MADDGIMIGTGGGTPQVLNFKRANRHGLIAGATGTGKTVTLQVMAEGFSKAGVPVFVADVKGDLSGLAMAGSAMSKTHIAFAERAQEMGLTDWTYGDNPAQLWDLLGEQGHARQAREAARPTLTDKMDQSAALAMSSSVGRQVANELGRAVFGGSSRRGSSGGIAQLMRGVPGGLLK